MTTSPEYQQPEYHTFHNDRQIYRSDISALAQPNTVHPTNSTIPHRCTALTSTLRINASTQRAQTNRISQRKTTKRKLRPSKNKEEKHKTFYKTFGRPIAKVFLMAIFTYQLAYYFWVRLEQDEMRAEMQGASSPAFLFYFLSPPSNKSSPVLPKLTPQYNWTKSLIGNLLRYTAIISDLEARIEALEQVKTQKKQ
ncbi:hypothetical protein F5Y12DRAFT_709915 [Xylaria sp. FL1777]|nr:hypothetical protein F5Y12DRAFT_709915 [Xylaria sp. FL1777]